jgi:hypothetical protein
LPPIKVVFGSARDVARRKAEERIRDVRLKKAKRGPKAYARLPFEQASEISEKRVSKSGRRSHLKTAPRAAIVDVRVVGLEAGDSERFRGKQFDYHFKFEFEKGSTRDEALDEIRTRLTQFAENMQTWAVVARTRVRFVRLEQLKRTRKKP